MNRILLLLVTGSLYINSCWAESKQPQSIVALAERVQTGLSEHFVFELTDSPNEQFEITNKGNKIVVRGSTLSSITTGLGWYLKYYCNSGTFWAVERNPISFPLPKVNETIVQKTSMKHRYYYNYCADRYSYRYWDWPRWEEEIDWMALNGINIALVLIDRGAVLWKTCECYGVRETVNRFFGDEIMPQAQPFFQLHEYEISQMDNRVRLQQAVIARMRELGISPMLDGFKGLVPRQLAETVKNVKFQSSGMQWNYPKEPLIDPSDPFFEEFGTKYYSIQKKLYGDQLFIGADPVVEGSNANTDFINLGIKVQNLILSAYPNAKWTLQGWRLRSVIIPNDELIKKTISQHTLILDLACEFRSEWRLREKIYSSTPWVWNICNNFGGRTGFFGNLDLIFDQQAEAKSLSQGKMFSGVGTLLEGIEQNPIVYNALFESAWIDKKPDMVLWVKDYAKSRYGKRNEHAEKAWEILYEKVYKATRTSFIGTTLNIMCRRPNQNITTVATTIPYFTNADIATAWDEMVTAADELSTSDGFQHDLVDLTREILKNRAYDLFPKVIEAHQQGNRMAFDKLSKQFLELFDDMELILSTRKEFMVATWIERHRNWGQNEAEKNYLERWAKTMITIYGPKNLGVSGDYACREWSGTMKDLYKARFEKYFIELRKMTDKNAEPKVDWYEFDYQWTATPSNYTTRTSCCPVDACKTIHKKYQISI